jgi:hypothetical protein
MIINGSYLITEPIQFELIPRETSVLEINSMFSLEITKWSL